MLMAVSGRHLDRHPCPIDAIQFVSNIPLTQKEFKQIVLSGVPMPNRCFGQGRVPCYASETHRMDVVMAAANPPSTFPAPGSDAWCDRLIDWKGNLSSFPGPVTNELVEACLLNDQVSKEYLEPPQYHWLALVLLVIPLAGVLGNSLVCIAVWQERRLHNVTNFFLVSLALADLMVCLAVMPFGVLELFYDTDKIQLAALKGIVWTQTHAFPSGTELLSRWHSIVSSVYVGAAKAITEHIGRRDPTSEPP
ncbi:D(2) dopamine receptor-like [Tropilaelaps mercedesae]|uniref:D(2) dopamine receptor-like n=1 Tax=Tropilaelaps mercedesae TaxID=418985 RepID=A0A1V9XT23_9ACAR|nr:D(2) dopamine receptor-like [Tropilaelaps mercedesae]